MKILENKQNYKIYSCIAIFCAVVFFVPIIVQSATSQDDALDDKYDKLNKLEKKEKKYRDIINLKAKEQEIINAQVKKLEADNQKIEQNIKKSEETIKTLENDIERTKKEMALKEKHITIQKKVLERFIREMYQDTHLDVATLTFLDFANKDISSHKDTVSHATSKINDYVKTIRNEQKKLEEEKKQLEEKTKKIADEKYALEERSNQLEGARNYKRVLASQVSVEKDKYQKKLSKVLEEQLAIQQEIAGLSTSKIGTFSLADLPSKDEADFEYPMKKPFVQTQGYGKTSFSSHYKGGMHNGIDLVARGSQSIIAPAKGKVKATGNMGKYGYGKWVAIDHGNGLITLYGHLSSVKVSRGEKVKQGEKIGIMGNTGFSTGPHLHFSVFAGSTFAIVESSSVPGIYIPTGATVNPNMYL